MRLEVKNLEREWHLPCRTPPLKCERQGSAKGFPLKSSIALGAKMRPVSVSSLTTKYG